MTTKKAQAEGGKENGKKQLKDAEMAGTAKASAKRDAGDKASKQPKKPRKEAAAAPTDADKKTMGSGRQAAQNISFQDSQRGVRLDSRQDRLEVKEEARCETEAAALAETQSGAPAVTARRLGDFSVVDEAGSPEPLESSLYSQKPLFLCGVVYPRDGPATKDTGRRVERVGPLRAFSLALAGKEAGVVVATAAATYTLSRPSAVYRKHFGHLAEQAALVLEVHHALSPAHGGTTAATLEEVIARLARTKVVKGYATAREGLLVNGKFVLAQLAAADAAGGAAAPQLAATGFAAALGSAVQEFRYEGAQRGAGNPGGIVIARDGGAAARAASKGKAAAAAADGGQMDADEEFARQMQAKIDNEMRNKRPAGPPKGSAAYIKVSEAEIADDYPPPAPYNKEEEETDELLLFDEDTADADPEFLPRRLLTDFSLYNAEGLLATLELLPMASGVDPDAELYASGVVVEDDGDFSGGQALAAAAPADDGAGGSGSSAPAAGGSAAAPAAPASDAGMRMYLSQIREWVVEYGADCLFISIRTDVAWYRLAAPAARYAPWYEVVLKTARLAARVLGMLSEETRASKLSLSDVIKRLTALPPADPCHVSKKADAVERFVVVHSQIVLNCFHNYPVKAVRESAFAAALRARLATVRHSKLYRAAPRAARGVNRNPMRDRAAGARSKPMTATATAMVKSVWQAYFRTGGYGGAAPPGEGEEEEGAAGAAPVAQEVDEDVNEEENEDDATENALAETGGRASRAAAGRGGSGAAAAAAAAKKPKAEAKAKAAPKKKAAAAKAAWVGAPTSTEGGLKFYARASLGDWEFGLGDAVELTPEEGDDSEGEGEEGEGEAAPQLGLVQAMWQDASGGRHLQVRQLVRGADTVLGDAASDSELFLAVRPATRPLAAVAGPLAARCLERAWDASARGAHFQEDLAVRAANEAAAAAAAPLDLFWRRQYVPEQGMFRDPPKDLRLGARLPEGEAGPEPGVKPLAGGAGFVKDGVTYAVGDFMFVGPEVFDRLDEAAREVQLPDYLSNSRFHKGSHTGLRAWGVGRLVKLGAAGAKKGRDGGAKLATVSLQRYWRPEDVSEDAAYRAGSYYDLYAGDETVTVEVADVVGPVAVVPAGGPTSIASFACVGSYSRKDNKFGPAPKDLLPSAARASGKGKGKASADVEMADAAPAPAGGKGKGKAAAGGAPGAFPGDDGVALATMDIFAGCGGLSEGFHQAGAAYTKWAVEYEHPAAESFKLNNPQAATFANNCNVLLHAAMAKAGLEGDCEACPEAVAESAALPAGDVAALPAPGEVDFICGGPPCQGYSGMNRFNKGNWSMVQNSMVMAFLSYADFYRPRYFLLENVRNFVSHNKSFTFRLTVRSLLDMGYQVRFGVLNAGNFGVAQSRKRTFIWAAAPGELLPDWPALMHAFRTPQLTINLPGNVQYTAVPQTVGAPLRPVTVRDAIGDLPPIANGHDAEEMAYAGPPHSAFQAAIRGDCARLTDHISKHMNDLNLERCRCIPKNCPGADWRVLEAIVRADPARELYKGQPLVPWCLPNTADRHNGWRGLFGRLDMSGHFPTSTTDPQPMGKVGQVFHPEQDRIVSVRECARAQGFPDKHRFWGNVHNKHRQVGNAVPPPLAAALGRQLRAALEAHAQEAAREALAAQM